jgi:hypothetical protein
LYFFKNNLIWVENAITRQNIIQKIKKHRDGHRPQEIDIESKGFTTRIYQFIVSPEELHVAKPP